MIIEKCIYKKGIDIMKKEILLVGLGIMRRYGVMVAWNDKQIPPDHQKLKSSS